VKTCTVLGSEAAAHSKAAGELADRRPANRERFARQLLPPPSPLRRIVFVCHHGPQEMWGVALAPPPIPLPPREPTGLAAAWVAQTNVSRFQAPPSRR
jgi:hypothetical protein